ncbi:hypothetical protein AAZX31_01G226200 [Glycine max]|uniref:Uncharacterized protein n=2 Tax=Glycine max TaxID=3847 RepID=K7K5L3_SOYBN|nr:hypothetical protein GYH30_002497 [Glycine max]KRH77909.1 hypothetical protein GLYMA_01G241100v4 [Glycine max]
MIKQSSSRNNRSKGIKVKHVLQIILLLGVCFWLIYQVKHSHDKKKEFHENDAKVHEEDENILEDEDKHEHNEHEEGNEHESEEKGYKRGVRGGGDEQEEVENKNNEVEDERSGGDDEIDENDQEQSAVDTDRDEEFMDEEKEKEEESSSAVTRDTGTTSTESETLLENSDVNSAMNMTKSENRSTYTKESNRGQHSSNLILQKLNCLVGLLPMQHLVKKLEATACPTHANTSSESNQAQNGTVDTLVTEDVKNLHNITTTYLDSHSEAGSNLTAVISGGNLAGTSANTSSESNQAQHGTMNATVTEDAKNVQTEGLEQSGNRVSEENLPGSNSTVPVETEKEDAAAGKSSNLEGGELENTAKFVASNETENNSDTEMSETNKNRNISYVKENTDVTKNEFKGDTQTDETSDSP